MTDRHLRRLRERWAREGYDGLFDRRRQQPSPKQVAWAILEQILQLYRTTCAGFNVQHFHEKLGEIHGVTLSYSWVKHALQVAGLVPRRRPRGPHRRRRERPRCPACCCTSMRAAMGGSRARRRPMTW
ncbi:MAG: hypothetical protein QN178_15300 [Armatimonadota bacterium]|nr:hypothetical protein [Armatimonadota bacterium]